MTPLVLGTFFLLFVMILLRTLLLIVTVEGTSMIPTFNPGDRLLVMRFWPKRLVRKGHIVVGNLPFGQYSPFLEENPLFIKRVVALPLESYVTDIHELLPHQQTQQAIHYHLGKRVWKIPAGHIFVKGDSSGSDSRTWGPIAISSIRGLVIGRLLPRNHPGS